MPKSEKWVVGLALLFLVLCLGLICYSVFGLNIRLPTCVTAVKPFEHGNIIKHTDQKYEVQFVAKMWSFDPAEVKLPKGSQVDIFVTSQDVLHGFHILNTHVNLMAVPGTVNFAQINFNKPGEYKIVCHEYCGMGHQNMTAKIIVE